MSHQTKEIISIIVPVYRVESYLPKCLDSIIAQTYPHLEIILIEDGSPDRCGEICDKYAEKDTRIRVIHKANEGVARARNDGISCASGDYISFIDSDDWISENTYETLLQGIKRYEADCAVGRCVTVLEKNDQLFPQNAPLLPVRCETARRAMEHVLLKGSAIWNRLFKREIFAGIRFPEGRVNDDEMVALHAYAVCKKIVFLNQDTYYYRIRKNSITTSKFSLRNMDCYYNSIDNMNFIRQTMPELMDRAQYKYIKAMLYCYVNLMKMKKTEEIRKLLQMLRTDMKKNKKSAYENKYVTILMKALVFFLA